MNLDDIITAMKNSKRNDLKVFANLCEDFDYDKKYANHEQVRFVKKMNDKTTRSLCTKRHRDNMGNWTYGVHLFLCENTDAGRKITTLCKFNAVQDVADERIYHCSFNEKIYGGSATHKFNIKDGQICNFKKCESDKLK